VWLRIKTIGIALLVLMAIVMLVFFVDLLKKPNSSQIGQRGQYKILVYKTPTCGCCGEYIKYLERHGVVVEVVNVDNIFPVLQRFNVPPGYESCHVALWEGYTVVGHVPFEIIDKMLRERPEIEGITLPGMPPGSPGMPGEKSGEWKIYAFKNGEIWIYAVS